MTIDEILNLDDAAAAAHGLYNFESLGQAVAFRNRATKLCVVLQGDDDRFWVATGRLAQELEAAGYEVVGVAV